MTDAYKTKKRKIQRSVLVGERVCNTHSCDPNDHCHVPACDFGCSGLPCTDMSRAGYQMKRDGPTNAVFMTHGRYVEATKVPVFIIECTPEPR